MTVTAAPCIVAFAGHMIDLPDRRVPRFAPSSERAVAQAIAQRLDQWNARLGVCSLARGADLLFAEAMLERGGAIHAILPISVPEFLRESVELPGDASWVERFQRVIKQVRTLDVYGDAYLAGSGTPFHVATLLIDGHARLHAAAQGQPARALAVWDGKAGDGFGGTASFVGHCVSRGRETVCIAPDTGREFIPDERAIAAAARHSWARLACSDQTLEHRLVGILFADARGFSSLKEPQVPGFVQEVVGAVRRAIESTPPRPRIVNTWGDGLFMVTDDIEHAGLLGLALVREAARIDHRAMGRDEPMQFRVGLHAGPAFVGVDPVTGRPNAYGADVSLAARIEPVVTPGEVWCSGAYAGLASATGSGRLEFSAMESRALAKGAGPMQLWRVEKR